jgi:sigma-E factor negative regulatory protein RseC
MTNPQGTIVAITRDAGGIRAVVEVEAEVACARCANGRGCGAGIFQARAGSQRLDIAIGPDLEVSEGDLVDIELAPQNVLRAALIVYGLPLAGAAIAAALAYRLELGDAGAAVTALGGLAAGAMFCRFRLRDDGCLARFTPSVSRRAVPDA